MLPVILALILATGGSSAVGTHRPHHVLLASSHSAAVANRPLSSFSATFDGMVENLSWTQTIAGTNGVGAGNDVFRVAVLVDGVSVCHIDVACEAVADTDHLVTCPGADFTSGQDVDVKTTSMPCSSAPSGFQTTGIIHH